MSDSHLMDDTPRRPERPSGETEEIHPDNLTSEAEALALGADLDEDDALSDEGEEKDE